jgi:hypothetical protein
MWDNLACGLLFALPRQQQPWLFGGEYITAKIHINSCNFGLYDLRIFVYRPNNSNQMRLFFIISAYLCAEGCPTVQPLVEFSSITAMCKQIPSSVKEQIIVMSNHMPSNHVARITGVTNSSVSSAGQPSQGLG